MAKVPASVEIRRPRIDELQAVRHLVQTVVDETYGGLWTEPPLAIAEEDWSKAWVAASARVIAGMVLTQNAWIDDLWVLKDYRNAGIGRLLLAKAEREIAGRGHASALLRVVSSNRNAIRFYVRWGWSAQRAFPHEKFPIEMTEMGKILRP